jgi:hypothetical protein
MIMYRHASAADPHVSFTMGKGVTVTSADSMVSLNLSFFMQPRLDVAKIFDRDFKPQTTAQLRRTRLLLRGFAFTPKLEYTIQLGFSPADIRAGILYDAFLKFTPVKQFAIQFGEAKLPGEREEITSDNNLQFVDRSTTAGLFKLDRDFALQLTGKLGRTFLFCPAVSISTGEGRNNATASWQHFDYTARAELLPLGDFTNHANYAYGDLERELSPKLSIAGAYDFNNKAGNTKGQLGGDVVADSFKRNVHTVFSDFNFKFKGMSVSGEYAYRFIPDNTAYIAGQSFWVAAGYNFRRNYEPAFRFTRSYPGANGNIDEVNEYTFAFNKYIYRQALKVQTDYTIIDNKSTHRKSGVWRFQFQIII